jgi:hypothetical protein
VPRGENIYQSIESMNEKAPEEAERRSALRCRSARVITKSRAWVRSRMPWGRRWRGLSRQEPHASGGRVHGRTICQSVGYTEGNMLPDCRGAGSQNPWSDAGRSQKLHPTNRWPTWRATVPYRARFSWVQCA